jgi:alanyl-tRNA synthetase
MRRKKKKKNDLRYSGKTTDNKIVIAGVFYFTSTHGLPLEIIIGELYNNNMTVDWYDYCKSALKFGQKESSMRAGIREAIVDNFGPFYLKEFLIRLEKVIEAVKKEIGDINHYERK